MSFSEKHDARLQLPGAFHVMRQGGAKMRHLTVFGLAAATTQPGKLRAQSVAVPARAGLAGSGPAR
jgi:hypothetical protein